MKEFKKKTLVKINACWICDSWPLRPIKESNVDKNVTSGSFAITDSRYGITTELSQCSNCQFIQSTDLTEVLSFYEDLEDPSYEANRKERLLQARKIIQKIKKYIPSGKLLDIGAGSGILVEEARRAGFDAQGVEPSAWLQKKAHEHNLPVHLGTFPHVSCTGPYDIITIIDVIEHVNNPVQLLQKAHKALAKNGIIIVVTPHVRSLVARTLGFKWWHFRIAHIGYFDKNTLDRALTSAKFKKITMTSATWYFALDYLVTRVNTYLPSWGKIPIHHSFGKVTVPLNLYDSLLAIYSRT